MKLSQIYATAAAIAAALGLSACNQSTDTASAPPTEKASTTVVNNAPAASSSESSGSFESASRVSMAATGSSAGIVKIAPPVSHTSLTSVTTTSSADSTAMKAATPSAPVHVSAPTRARVQVTHPTPAIVAIGPTHGATGAASNETTVQAIERTLKADKKLAGAAITVKVTGATVELDGTATSPGQKDDAENVVYDVQQARKEQAGVLNNLMVKEPFAARGSASASR